MVTHDLIPRGVYHAQAVDSELRITRSGLRLVTVELKLIDLNAAGRRVYVNLVPNARWCYRDQLRALELDLEVYFEWHGVDLCDVMLDLLQPVLADRYTRVWVDHVTWRGVERNRATLVAEDT